MSSVTRAGERFCRPSRGARREPWGRARGRGRVKAMVLRNVCDLRRNMSPLSYELVAEPEPGPDELLLEVTVCGVCHTELDEIEGRTPPRRMPMILGHQ